MLNKKKDHHNVNHPSHYTSLKAFCPQCITPIECIDITRHMDFNLGNAMKYIWRAEYKENKREQIEKAIWYLEDYIKYFTLSETNKEESP
jgi:Protein of unknwon function (DUF3310)